MKSFVLLIVIVFSSTSVFSQHIKFNWQSCFFSPGYQLDVFSTSIVSTGDGYLILCSVEKGGPPEGDFCDIWLIKTDTAGNFLWEKYFGGSLIDEAVNITPVGDGNYFIFGLTSSTDGGATIPPYLPQGGLWYIKIDSEGNKLWDMVASSPNSCFGYGASSLSTFDKGLLSTANSCGGGGGNVSNYYGGYDAWLLKVNMAGNIDWDFTIGTDGFDVAGVTIQTTDSGFLVPLQCIPGSTGNIICDSSLLFSSIGRAVLVKLDKNRNIQWQQCLGASYHIGFNNALEVADGYVIGGYACAEDGATAGTGYHEGYSHLGSNTADIWLRKTDFEGNLIWQKCYGGSNNDYISQLFNTTDGNLIVFGTTNSFNGDVNGLHYDPYYPTFASDDIWMFKVNGSNGDLLWNRCIGDRGDERMEEGVLQQNDKNYILATRAEIGQLDDILCGPYPSDITFAWVFSITDTTAYLGMPEMQDLSKRINLYPNPATDYITLEIPTQFDMKHTQAEIFDTSGKILKSTILTGQKPYLYTGDLPAGLYLLRLVNKDGFVSKRFVKF